MPLSAEAQRARKLARLEALLGERGLVAARLAFRAPPHTYAYRNRIRLKIDEASGVRFFNEHKDPRCAVLEPGLISRLTELCERSHVAPALFAPFPHLELRSDDDLGRPGILFGRPSRELVPRGAAQVAQLRDLFPGALIGIDRDPDVAVQRRRIIEGVSALVPLDAFLQVNTAVNAELVTALVDGAVARGAKRALDLYSGAGNFSLPLAAAKLEVTAVELHGSAARAAARAAHEQRLDCESIADTALAATTRMLEQGRRYDLVLVDAPRAGAPEVIRLVSELRPESVAVCSCNAKTFARDAETLVRGGYELESVCLFDMFPHTDHVEILAWFGKSVEHTGP